MGTQQDEWEVQTTLKHGPTMNDKGDRLIMTNLRGYTVGSVIEHLEDFADKSDRFDKAVDQIFAKDALRKEFTVDRVREDDRRESRESRREPEREERREPARGGVVKFRDRDGELCRAHDLSRKWKEVKSNKDGKWYELLECTAGKDPCKALWPDKD